MPLLEEDYILGFDEIEVSQKDAKCQLAEKWVEKTVTDSELQVSEDDTQIHIKGREFAYDRHIKNLLYCLCHNGCMACNFHTMLSLHDLCRVSSCISFIIMGFLPFRLDVHIIICCRA